MMNSDVMGIARPAGVLLAVASILIAGCSNIPLIGSGKSAASKRVPMRSSPINLVGDCKQKEVDGFEENAQVVVDHDVVRNLSWRMRIGHKGTCRFDGSDFVQTRRTSSIELTAKDGSGCRLLMWGDSQVNRITLAHSNCARFCTQGAYEKAWPVMFDPRTGGCANNNR